MIVGLAPQADFEIARGRANSVTRELDFGDIGKAVAGRFPEQAIEALERNPNVQYVEPDGEVYAHDQITPWGIDRIDADVVHESSMSADGAHIAIIDTGIDDTHPDLQPNLGQGYAVETCSGWNCNYDWSDDRGHGTHCAGTAAAADTGDGVIGVAPEATLHSVKVLDDEGSGTWSGVADGIQWVADQGYDVASLSLGGSSGSATLHNAVQYANNNGVLVVSSAGNDGPCTDCVGYPAAYNEVVAVSATDSSDSLASFSSAGPEIELAAPGVNVYSTEIGGYDTKSGTSMACPHVSGVGAQLMANGYTNTEARQRLQETAEDIGLSANAQGYGLVDAAEAVLGESIVGEGDHFHIEGPGEFYFEVSGQVEPDPEVAPYATYGEDYGDDWVSFTLSDTGETYWWFEGDIVELEYTDEQTVWINGEEHDDGDGGALPEPPVIEDFERDNPLAEYGGETGLFGTTSSAYEGSQALVNDSGSFGGVNSTSGLNSYPERGDTIDVHFNNASENNFVAFNLFSQSETDNADRYAIGLSGVSGDLTLWKTESGDIDTLDSASPSSTTSGWYRLEVSTDASTITANLYDDSSDAQLASVSTSDTTFSSGGIGFRSAGNGEVFDYVVESDAPDPGPTVVEDFERASPLNEYGGSTGLFGTTSSPTYEGSSALVNDGGSFGGVNSTSGLDTYPERGDDVHVYFQNASGDNFVSFNLFSQAETDNPDRYSVGLSGVSGDWTLWKTENGDIEALDSASPSDTTAGWYRAEISTDGSSISADLYDDSSDTLLASVSASDSTFSSGGIGFRSAGNGEVFDYVVLDD